jgi:hypothetical protein
MLTLPDTWPALAATKLAPANFTADHPRVWPLMANIDGLYAIFKTSLEAQYDAYETEAKPKLKDVVLVRGSLLPAMCGRAFVAHPDIALCVRVCLRACAFAYLCVPREALTRALVGSRVICAPPPSPRHPYLSAHPIQRPVPGGRHSPHHPAHLHQGACCVGRAHSAPPSRLPLYLALHPLYLNTHLAA